MCLISWIDLRMLSFFSVGTWAWVSIWASEDKKKNEKKLPVQSERWLHEKRLDKERLVSVHVALRTAFWRHTLFAMNNYTEKDCFFFEDQLHFDSTEEVFITNIVTCILNSFFSLLTCIGNFIVVFVIGKTRSDLKSAKSNLYISVARLLKNSKSSRRSLGTLSPILLCFLTLYCWICIFLYNFFHFLQITENRLILKSHSKYLG